MFNEEKKTRCTLCIMMTTTRAFGLGEFSFRVFLRKSSLPYVCCLLTLHEHTLPDHTYLGHFHFLFSELKSTQVLSRSLFYRVQYDHTVPGTTSVLHVYHDTRMVVRECVT